MKRINRCNEVVKLLSAAKCCAKAIVDVAAVEFRFSLQKLLPRCLYPYWSFKGLDIPVRSVNVHFKYMGKMSISDILYVFI